MMSLTPENLMNHLMNIQVNTKRYLKKQTPLTQSKLKRALTLFIALIGTLLSGAVTNSSHAEVKFSCQELRGDVALECALKALGEDIPAINNLRWRDQSYREYAKQLLRHNKIDNAIEVVSAISSPDTQALTIRAIGFGVQDLALSDDKKNSYFDLLHIKAGLISQKDSQEIALTYLAMAEANADLFDRALQNAKKIETLSLRQKSFQEIAEIMAAKSEIDSAFIALQNIEDLAFKNKAYGVIASAFIKEDLLSPALQAVSYIDDPYIKANALLDILTKQDMPINARTEQGVEKSND
jgi:hypothetical protein